jgi:hypothetical protein
MFIPPSNLESTRREYQPEYRKLASPSPVEGFWREVIQILFAKRADSTENIPAQSTEKLKGAIWPVRKIYVPPESLGEIISGIVLSSLGLWYVVSLLLSANMVEIRRGLFFAPLVGWLVVDTVKMLYYRKFPERQKSILLDVDRLVLDPDHNPLPKTIYYEQIYTAGVYGKTGAVGIKYFLYDTHTGALNLSCLRSIVLPKTEDNLGLCEEIERRCTGPLPSQRAQIAFAVWNIGKIVLMLLSIPAYLFFAGILMAIFT